ncbi:endonuclease MutS2 [Laceyella sacchari]|uniref:Endonuclease MutS2 n=1 Tax=Laceyella sacchari TaxID=37482 RepID=A0ABY5U891_LACSH|nr:endonuclease MutS2 [Laceyella sacchari]UWE04532.1 endonuclease MutS2 [Laceyella sacchari]
MEQWTLKSLEFHRVKEIVKEQAATFLGKEKIDQLAPSADRDMVEQWLAETREGMDLLRLKGDVPFGGIRDIRASIRRAKVGGMLNEAECLDIATTISGGRKVKSHLRQLEVETAPLPRLRELTEQIESLDQLEAEILACIDEHAVVKDQASPELRRIRQQMDGVRQQIQQTLNQMLRSSHYTKMMQEPLITQRFDRYVIPVKQEYRGQFGGIVHDQSSSGATLFIEPEAVVQLGNRLRELEMAEQKEVERILSLLTSKVAEVAEELSQNIERLGVLDFIVARSRYGYLVKGVCPKIAEDRVLVLKQARHPLIPSEEVVPIHVEMGKHYQAIIITGPNTGGKTVTLKTVGLLALMTQSGLPIPAQEESVMPIFSGVFADIGDEQSIEQSLSTFSGHLTNIIGILQKLDESSLVLFDELGAGTDPTEGAALAMAILEHVIERGSMVVATTHYSELKLFAHTHPQAINASVEFDVETLRPTYRLLIGVPGRSNAFAISTRLGLPAPIIDLAKRHISSEENKLEEMITSLTNERKWAEEERKQAEALRNEAEALYEDLRQQMDQWEEEKARLKEKARQEAIEAVAKAKTEAEDVLKELREWAKLRPQDIKEHELIELKKRLDASIPEAALPKKKASRPPKPQQIQVGDEVLVLTVNQKGTVVEDLGQNEYQVQIGFLKMKVHRDQLEKQAAPKQKPKAKSHATVKRSTADVKPELDLRGKLVEEALMEIDQYLDKAILSGYKQISLIHGKGTGALRTGVQEFLRRHRAVKTFRLGAHGEGGSGVTVVELR